MLANLSSLEHLKINRQLIEQLKYGHDHPAIQLVSIVLKFNERIAYLLHTLHTHEIPKQFVTLITRGHDESQNVNY